MKIDPMIALLTLRVAGPEHLFSAYSKNGLPTLQKETHVKHRAGVLLAQRGPGLCPRATVCSMPLQLNFAGGKAVLLRRTSKTINFTSHTHDVSWVTDRSLDTLLMFGYSATSFIEFATSSFSGEVQLGSRPALAELTFLEETPVIRNCICPKRQPASGPIASKYFPTVSGAASTAS